MGTAWQPPVPGELGCHRACGSCLTAFQKHGPRKVALGTIAAGWNSPQDALIADAMLTRRLVTVGHIPAPERRIALGIAAQCSTIAHSQR